MRSNTPNNSSGLIKPIRMMLATFAALTVLLLATIPAASAETVEIDQLEIGPIVDIGPLDIGVLSQLTASASVDCEADDVLLVKATNNTDLFTSISISIDGEEMVLLFVTPHTTFESNYAATENSAAQVVVVLGGNELVNKELDVDCLAPDPWYNFIANCDIGQAWVELGNNGPDSATMGVHYDDLPFAGGTLLAGESSVQPLAVQPNEFAAFAIEVDGEAIYSDGFLFDCPEPVEPIDEVEEPEPTPVATETPEAVEVEVVTEPTPEETQTGGESEAIEGDDELAMAAGLEIETESTSTSVMIGLLMTLGLATVVGAIAALKLRR